ncbi:butyrophilin subfamily 1 member A1-like isoform X4 [Alligator sinensis]|uniref:Butyrophilin subfamily 1 member A1-like isoform X4 n=1 Tax=Alligator sinensis TaxID=38654 RepID=A0A3Q0FYG2_ALLSI|nr:butyrophilin subfamily 1 member A1-like isoform X4 [Alligator sinensis]
MTSSLWYSSMASTSIPGLIIFCTSFYIQKLESAQFSVIGPDQPVTAVVGQDIILSCHLSPRMSAENMEVRWFQNNFETYVHLYRDGRDYYEQQMPKYQKRTELLKDGIMDGNISLKILNIERADEGQYNCFVQDGITHDETILDLHVAVLGSVPLISVEDYQDGGIHVVCQSAGWFPEPKLVWRDPSGQHLPSVSETKAQKDNGLFEAATSIVIKEYTNSSLSCWIRDKYLSQGKESAVYISGDLLRQLGWRRDVICPGLGRTAPAVEKEKVTLDPDTAHPSLILSEDQRSVTWKGTQKHLPNNPERFDFWGCVLGCEKFTSGRHCWTVEVEVETGKFWAVGVARESVGRKGGIKFNPEEGIWAVGLWGGKFQALTAPDLTPLYQMPNRICVCLDCAGGWVSFSNGDTEALIFTFLSASFTRERIRPWLWLWEEGAEIRLCN